jgi:phenylacetate-coenzyme A ligase PaaK-like adenylate-forming protein
MMDLTEISNISPYSLKREAKHAFLNKALSGLTRHHYEHCSEYRKILDSMGFDIKAEHNYEELPFLPVRLFKMMDLLSVGRDQIVKTMTSSGTTGQAVSRIYLDKETSTNQTSILTKIVSSYIGQKRLPMIVIDSPEVIKDRNLFSARGAGILGFSIFGNKRIFALNEKMELNLDLVKEFIAQNPNEKFFLFGFTFMVWNSFCRELIRRSERLDLKGSILIHGGGWKKLAAEKVESHEFKSKLNEVCGIERIHDYYGMVEQTGTIYVECEYGHLHAPVFSDIIIRRSLDFSVTNHGERGIIQVLSILPNSYPGHSLLTEDEGILLGEDDCQCGRSGKYFRIVGRLANAEIRGCSDVYTGSVR